MLAVIGDDVVPSLCAPVVADDEGCALALHEKVGDRSFARIAEAAPIIITRFIYTSPGAGFQRFARDRLAQHLKGSH